jgi:hypothetical protein
MSNHGLFVGVSALALALAAKMAVVLERRHVQGNEKLLCA